MLHFIGFLWTYVMKSWLMQDLEIPPQMEFWEENGWIGPSYLELSSSSRGLELVLEGRKRLRIWRWSKAQFCPWKLSIGTSHSGHTCRLVTSPGRAMFFFFFHRIILTFVDAQSSTEGQASEESRIQAPSALEILKEKQNLYQVSRNAQAVRFFATYPTQFYMSENFKCWTGWFAT